MARAAARLIGAAVATALLGGCRSVPTGAGRDLSSDRAAFFGPSRCADAHLQLCEDFESGAVDPTVWTVTGTAPVVDTLQAARGTHALHITVPGKGASYIDETKTFPAANDTYYGRAFVYFQSLPTPASSFDYAHWTFIAASGTGVTGEVRVGGQMQNGVNLFGVGTDSLTDPNGTGDWTNPDQDPGPNGTPSPVPTGQWLCLEWMHDGAQPDAPLVGCGGASVARHRPHHAPPGERDGAFHVADVHQRLARLVRVSADGGAVRAVARRDRHRRRAHRLRHLTASALTSSPAPPVSATTKIAHCSRGSDRGRKCAAA